MNPPVVQNSGSQVPATVEGSDSVVVGGMIAAPEDVNRAVELFQALEDFKANLLDESDCEYITTKGKTGTTTTKIVANKGYSKIAFALGLSDEIVALDFQYDDHGNIVSAQCRVRVTHPSGRYSEGIGVVFAKEMGNKGTLHNIQAKAHTRGRVRAIKALIGGVEPPGDAKQQQPVQQRPPQRGRQPVQQQPVQQQQPPHFGVSDKALTKFKQEAAKMLNVKLLSHDQFQAATQWAQDAKRTDQDLYKKIGEWTEKQKAAQAKK